MNFTESQLAAIQATGNVLVSAGAGAGKTSTLVECCLKRVLDPVQPCGLDQILMVTFTEAAAAEMKERIHRRLVDELEQTTDDACRNRLEKEIALLETAAIGTLHGFCFRLIREHFHELGIDPQVSVIPQDQCQLLMRELFDGLLEDHYSGSTLSAASVQELIEVQAQGRDAIIRDLVFQIHHYTQTRPNPKAWFKTQADHFLRPEPADWINWLLEGFRDWRDSWIERLRSAPADNTTVHACANILANLASEPSRTEIAETTTALKSVEEDYPWPKGKKETFRRPFARFFEETEFFRSLAKASDSTDPLAEDWTWVRAQMGTLLRLAEEFSEVFAQSKKEQALLDFHDLEQFALRLLWDPSQNGPSDLARRLQGQYSSIFVDEYQDINPAQDRIIQALARESPNGNRFLVGDVKQSIYRFRLAAPGIFQEYRKKWSLPENGGRVLFLPENFRSRESLLQFINPLFEQLMRESVGGVPYLSEDALVFGASEHRRPLAHASNDPPHVELHIILRSRNSNHEEESDTRVSTPTEPAPDPSQTEEEARLVAHRLATLIREGHPVWDTENATFRNVRWSDMAILLRSLKDRGPIYAKEFRRRGIPLLVPQTGFYDNTEVSDLVSLLQLLDNPLQDLPLLAVLRSPFVGLSLNRLAEMRVIDRHTYFWNCLKRWHELNRDLFHAEPETVQLPTPGPPRPTSDWHRIDRFFERFRRWRSMARETSLSQRLEAILDETLYEDWLLSQPDGDKRAANVGRLLSTTREFDPLQRWGLQRFLQWVETQRDSPLDNEPTASGSVDAVSLTTIHRSKGLEFPVVVLADLGKRFNLRDLSGEIVLDERYGLCPLVKPPFTGSRYPSLPSWLAAKRQRREALGEELRLLYVALTRARDTLILAGTASGTTLDRWAEASNEPVTDHSVLSANCALDWLGPILLRELGLGNTGEINSSASEIFRWQTHESSLEPQPSEPASGELRIHPDMEPSGRIVDAESFVQLKRRIEWRYPYWEATAEPAKSAVTSLRKRFGIDTEESNTLAFEKKSQIELRPKAEGLSPADIGTAHHLFLQLANLEQLTTTESIESEAQRIRDIGALSAEETRALNLNAVLNFWTSETATQILEESGQIHRELPFTARFSLSELHSLLGPTGLETPGIDRSPRREEKDESGEFVLVQGIVDLAVVRETDIWILDYKTDAVSEDSVGRKAKSYSPQIRLYAKALERIHRKPVTKAWLHFLALSKTIEISEIR